MENIQVSKFLETKVKRKEWKYCDTEIIPIEAVWEYDVLNREAVEYLRRREAIG